MSKERGDVNEKKEFSVKLGLEIKKLRKLKGISIRNFETMTGAIDRYTLSKIENGKIMPTILTLKKICTVLDTSLGRFFTDFEKNEDQV